MSQPGSAIPTEPNPRLYTRKKKYHCCILTLKKKTMNHRAVLAAINAKQHDKLVKESLFPSFEIGKNNRVLRSTSAAGIFIRYNILNTEYKHGVLLKLAMEFAKQEGIEMNPDYELDFEEIFNGPSKLGSFTMFDTQILTEKSSHAVLFICPTATVKDAPPIKHGIYKANTWDGCLFAAPIEPDEKFSAICVRPVHNNHLLNAGASAKEIKLLSYIADRAKHGQQTGKYFIFPLSDIQIHGISSV